MLHHAIIDTTKIFKIKLKNEYFSSENYATKDGQLDTSCMLYNFFQSFKTQPKYPTAN